MKIGRARATVFACILLMSGLVPAAEAPLKPPTWPQDFSVAPGEPASFGIPNPGAGPIKVNVAWTGGPLTIAATGSDGKVIVPPADLNGPSYSFTLDGQAIGSLAKCPLVIVSLRLPKGAAANAKAAGKFGVQSAPVDMARFQEQIKPLLARQAAKPPAPTPQQSAAQAKAAQAAVDAKNKAMETLKLNQAKSLMTQANNEIATRRNALKSLAYPGKAVKALRSPAIAGALNKETSYVLKRFGVATPPLVPVGEKKVIVVDVNEPSQLADNVKPEEIVGVLDHHKLGGLATAEPIYVRIESLGSTSTLVARLFWGEAIDIPDTTAELLLAGILSDTLNFNSPTTTDTDKETAAFLNRTAGLDMDSLAQEMFKAKSDLTGVSSEELVKADYKVFDINGKKVGIGVFETVHPAAALERQAELVDALGKKKAADGLDHIFLSIIDILGEAAYTITASDEDKELVSKAFDATEKDGALFSPGIVSRKKQIVPAVEKVL